MSKRKQGFLKTVRRQAGLQSMVLPGVIFMIVFCFMPIYGLSIAFKNYTVVDTLDTAKWVGIDNYSIDYDLRGKGWSI
ncbi:MAG TPA: hypothetical protein VHQ24_06035 [Lachnospiraceae bacterium]|nr:hypothetical protein [Lachnospiraceae bacterium]